MPPWHYLSPVVLSATSASTHRLSSYQLLSLALPVALQMLMQSALGMVDVMMVAPLVPPHRRRGASR